MDSPVPKSNIVTEAKRGEGKGGVRQGGCVPPIARKALENAGKASLQVRLGKGTILAASRLKRAANADKEEGTREGKGSVIDTEQKENLAPAAAGDLLSSSRLMMPEARMPPAMPLPEETPLPKTPARQPEKSSAAVTLNDDLDDSLFEAMDTFSLKTPTAPCPVVPRKSSSASKSEISASSPINGTATLSLFSSASCSSDMSLCSPLPDLVPEDEELLWLEDPRASSNGGTRSELVSNLDGLLKRNVQTPASPLVKGTNLIRAPPVVGQSLQNTPEKAATCEKKMPISQSSPNILRNDLKRGELKPAISGSGRKRVVKSAAATPSPLAKESNLTRTVQQTSSEGTRMGSSPLAFANSAASSEAKRTICSPLAPKNSASSEGKRTIGSPLASAVLTPRRGNAASVRPHQGVPFNVKPTPSPTKSPGGRMVREPLSSRSPLPLVQGLKVASAPSTPRRHKLLPLKPLNVLDVTVDPSSTATLDSPLKPVQFTEVHRVVKKTLPVYTSSSSSMNNTPNSAMAPSKAGLLGKSSSSSRLPLPVSMVAKNA